MKKSIKTLIISAICVILLAVGLVFVLNIPKDEEADDEKTTNEAILIFDKTNLIPEDITISNKSGKYTLLAFDYSNVSGAYESSDESSDENVSSTVIYTMQEYGSQQLSKTMTDSLAEQCSYMAALQSVNQSGKNYAEYGLEKPRATVSVIYSDNSSVTMYIGNDAPDNKGVYFMIDGNKTVYLVQKNMINMFLTDKLQMFTKRLSIDFNGDYTVETINISGTFNDKAVDIKPINNTANHCNFIMESPYREICDNDYIEKFGEGLYSLYGTTVVAVDISKDDIKKYGLDKPYKKFEITSSDKSAVKISVSKADKDNNFYIMNPKGTIIYQMSVKDCPWYNAEYKDFLSKTIISPNMDHLIGVDITLNKNKYHYELTHTKEINETYEEVITNRALYNGKEFSYLNMSIFINNVSGISRTDSVPKSIDGCNEIFSIKYTFDKETKLTDTLTIYKTSDNRNIAVLNGNIECYTDLEYVKKVIDQVEFIAENVELEILTKNEESSKESEES